MLRTWLLLNCVLSFKYTLPGSDCLHKKPEALELWEQRYIQEFIGLTERAHWKLLGVYILSSKVVKNMNSLKIVVVISRSKIRTKVSAPP